MKNNLKPCPFCGCKIHVISTGKAIAGNTLYGVLCVCGAEGPSADSKQDAADTWNRRVKK